MVACPANHDLDRYLLGTCSAEEATSIETHLERCHRCRQWVSETRADESILEDVRRVVEREGYVTSTLEGARIGRFRILRRLGVGGMGVVYEAQQESPSRTVALKVMRPGTGGEHARRRFEHEAMALGRLRHPGIAQIYEAGIHVGEDRWDGTEQPYFAMELVDGCALTEHATKEGLGTRQRLALMVEICAATQHAHGKGVVHRDLKPANILVDESGRPKILDFGVARLTDCDMAATVQTDVGQLIGTIPYMSPEQVAGRPDEIDTRSDVYALGVIIYELLGGRLPHDLTDKSVPDAIRTISEHEPPPISSIDRVFRGDIETIVAKALARERERRYQSASELAADIERYLNHEPVTARPASAIYQLTKLAQRHRTLFVAAVTVLLVLVAAAVVSTGFALQAMERRDEAITSQEAEAAARFRAERITRFFQDMLESVNPVRAQGVDVTVTQVLDEAATRVTGELADQPLVEYAVRFSIAKTYQALGRFEAAEMHARAAIDAATRALGPEDVETLIARGQLALILQVQGRSEESEAIYREVLAMLEQIGDETRPELQTMSGLVVVLSRSGKYEEAEATGRRLVERSRTAFGPQHVRTAVAMGQHALTLEHFGRWTEAEDMHRQVLAIFEREGGEMHPDTLAALSNLAINLKRQRRFEEAEPLYRRSLELGRLVNGPEHLETLTTMNNLGVLLKTMRRDEEAEALYRDCLETSVRVLGETHPRSISTMNNLGVLLKRQGRLEEAERHLARALELQRQSDGEDHPRSLLAGANLARLYESMGEAAKAEAIYRDVVPRAERVLPPDHPELPAYMYYYGRFLVTQERFDEAEPYALEGYEWTRRFAADHPLRRNTAQLLVDLYDSWGRPEDAAPYRQELAEHE